MRRNFKMKLIKKLLKEGLAFKGLVNEIDWENTFSDVKKTCVEPKAFADYLQKVRDNKDKSTSDREKFDASHPYIHAKSSFFDKDSEELTAQDVDNFIKKMIKPPLNVVNTNEKILKSGGPHEYVYKTGIPAFRGLAYSIKEDKIYYINTCPGAGDCVLICYALKGRYIQYPVSYDSMTRRLNYLLNYPEKYEEKLYKEIKEKAKLHSAFEGYKAKVLLRWNDSGDFFADEYVKIAERVMKKLKVEGYNVASYAYTKIADVAKSDTEFDTTFSVGANKKETSKIDLEKYKNSVVVPKTLASGLNLMKVSDEETYKDRVAKHYNLDSETVITYDEMMQTPKGKEPKWFVIVTSEDGDDAAFRKDVKKVLLKFH